MARRVNQGQGQETEVLDDGQQPAVVGGGVGVESSPAKTTIDFPGTPQGSAERPPKADAEPVKVTRYQVMSTADILYTGARISFKAGKVLDDVTYDVPLLKRMGVALREIE